MIFDHLVVHYFFRATLYITDSPQNLSVPDTSQNVMMNNWHLRLKNVKTMLSKVLITHVALNVAYKSSHYYYHYCSAALNIGVKNE